MSYGYETKEAEKDALIEGLFKRLPEPGSDWKTEERRRWLVAAASIFDVMYKGGSEGESLVFILEEKRPVATPPQTDVAPRPE